MPRWTGSWLSGSAAAGVGPAGYPGQRLGLPATGRGSVASFGRRLAAYLVDAVVANLVVGLAYVGGLHPGTGLRGSLVVAAFAVEELVLVLVAGQTVGMRFCGVRVVGLRGRRPGFGWILARTVLLVLLVPALFWDRDNRGLHDRAGGVVLVRED